MASSDYKKPQYIEDAAKKIFDKDIQVIGSTQDELNKKIEHQTLLTSPPEEVGRVMVNIARLQVTPQPLHVGM